jgi:formate-dependent phosphoribosylglycinamide formyltransferase (GAR transformylase)
MQPRRFAASRVVSIRGWLVPGFCPTMKMASASSKSSRVTQPLPMPIVWALRAVPLDSWHMFEQSGRLFVPNARAKSWKRNAASLLVRPDV